MRGSAAAINTPNFAALVASVRRLALPLCAGVEPVQNRTWYVSQNVGSSGEMYACEACFKEGRAGVRDVFGTCAGAGAVAGVVCEAARVCDGADAGVCADSAGDARDVVIARMRLRQRRVLNASSLSYLNLSAVSSPSMQVLYGLGAPQMQYGMGVLGWGLTA